MKHSLLKAVLAGLVLASAASLASAAIKQSSIGNENGKLTRSDRVMALDLPGIDCTGLRDDRAVIAAAVTGSGVAVGKTLDMSGCLALLSSPGANGCAIDIAANTKIVGDGALRTGFALARRYCSGGDTPGGACDADADCQGGGTCVYDLDSTGSQLAANFAPSDGSIYKVVCSSAAYPEVSGVHIWGNQRSQNLAIMGGNDDAWGYCQGGTLDTAACASRCVGGSLPGFICNLADNSECTGGGTCTNRECNAGGGTCRAWTINTQHGGASGPGTIRAVDFDSATSGIISDVSIYDVRQSDYLVSTGGTATVSRVQNVYTSDTNILAQISYPPNPSVAVAVYAKNGSLVTDSRVNAWDKCFYLVGNGGGNYRGATAIGNTCGSQGGTTTTGWPGTVGFYLDGVGSNAIANRVTSGLVCGMSGPGSNIQNFIRNSCDLIPVLFQINGTHSSVFDNRNAWVTQGPAIAFNEMRGLCAGGSRSGKICLRKAPTSDTGLGCPSSTCDADTTRLADAGAGHFQISRNFIHQTTGAWEAGIAVDGTKRCAGGANLYKACTVVGDCPGSSCGNVLLANGQISDNFFYNVVAGNTVIDLTSSSYTTGSVSGLLISGNVIDQATTGVAIAMPATATHATNNKISGNLVSGTLTLANWDEQMGTTDWYGNTANDVAPIIKKLENRTASLVQYSVVEPSSGNNDAVAQAAAGTINAVGCSQDSTSPASGATIPVAIGGVAKCLVDANAGAADVDPNVTRGDPLKIHPATAGKLVKAFPGEPVIGYAMETTSADSSIRVLLEPRGQATEQIVADLPAAGCVGSTGYTYWDLPTTNPAVAACLGSNYARGVLAFADGANALSAYTSVVLPHLWSGSLYADIYWGASNTTAANVVWQVTGVCVAAGEGEDPALSSTANTVTSAVNTTNANDVTKATITLSAATNNPLNTCAADEMLHLRVFRDPANGSDNSGATANLYRVVLRQ